MLALVQQALVAGYTATQVLKFVASKFPQFQSGIAQAKSSGFDDDKILKFLSQKIPHSKSGVEKQVNANDRYLSSLGYKTKEEREASRNRALKGALGVGSAALSTYALARAIPQGFSALTGLVGRPGQTPPSGGVQPPTPIQPTPQRPPRFNPNRRPNQTQQPQAPNLAPQAIPNIQPQVTPPAQALQAAISPQQGVNANVASTMSQTPTIPQSAQSVQPEGISTTPPVQPNVNAKEQLQNLGILDKVDDMLKRGNTPEAIAASLDIKKKRGKVKGKVDPELVKTIGQYAQDMTVKSPIEVETSLAESPINENLPESNELVEEPEQAKPIAKKDVVATPNGVGEVKEIRNGQALVEVDGKLHKVKEEELQPEPEEVKTATFGFDPSTIPEELRSAPLNEVYLPASRKHVVVKYNAGLKPVRYRYFRKDGKPISEDYVNKIKEGVQLPVTSGLNFWGGWNADESDSRGAANYEELVANAQEEGKENDPAKEYWFEKEEAIYEHPYMEKAGKEQLRAMEKEFNEKRKKPKKPKK